MKKYILSTLLHYANRQPPMILRDKFYQIKNQILAHNAIQIGKQLQHVKKPCWSCDNGVFKGYDDGMGFVPMDWQTCFKCRGTGVFAEFYSVLVLWQFGKYRFHHFVDRIEEPILIEKYFSDLPRLEDISGTIKHQTPRNYLANECFIWLLLFYRPHLLKRKMFSGAPGRYVYTPMNFINRFLFELQFKIKGSYWRNKFYWKVKVPLLRFYKKWFVPIEIKTKEDTTDDLPF